LYLSKKGNYLDLDSKFGPPFSVSFNSQNAAVINFSATYFTGSSACLYGVIDPYNEIKNETHEGNNVAWIVFGYYPTGK
jgi:hypothetical protein